MVYLSVSNELLGSPYPSHLCIDLKDERLNKNLAALIHRKKGVIFRVNKRGELTPVQNLWSYSWRLKEEEEKIRQVVQQVIQGLESYLVSEKELSCQNKLSKAHKTALRHLIFNPHGPFVRMNSRLFKREWIGENSELEKCLFPKLAKAREAFFDSLPRNKVGRAFIQKLLKRERGNNAIDLFSCLVQHEKILSGEEEQKGDLPFETWLMQTEEALLEFTFQESEFVKQLGVDLAPIGKKGSGGARVAYDRSGKELLVEKAQDENSYGKQNRRLSEIVKRLFFHIRPCSRGNVEIVQEVASYIADRNFKIYIVLPTGIRKVYSEKFAGSVKKKRCSIQMWLDKADDGAKFLQIPHSRRVLPKFLLSWLYRTDKMPDSLAEALGTLGVIGDDTDMHLQNFLVKTSIFEKKENGQKIDIKFLKENFFRKRYHQDFLLALLRSDKVERGERVEYLTLVKHDNGLSFPRAHPRTHSEAPYQYLFAAILSQFEQNDKERWSEDAKTMREKKGEWYRSLNAIALNDLRNVLTDELFEKCDKVEFEELFFRWLHASETKEEEVKRRLELIEKIADNLASLRKNEKLPELSREEMQEYKYYFKLNMIRIRDIVGTAKERWDILLKNLDAPRAEVFKYRTQAQFRSKRKSRCV